MSELLATLNEAQQQAVTHGDGPAMVLAGAGSGKTRVLTTRAAWLIQKKGIMPEELLLVTFTNKAAGEINERLEQLIGQRLPFAGTFHSVSAKILRKHGYLLGLNPNFLIYDTDDQLALLRQLYKKYGFSKKQYNPKAVKGKISSAKNELIEPAEYESIASGSFQKTVAQIYKKYQNALRENQAVDFDDLLLLTVRLLQNHPTVRRTYQEQLKHILIDEYQDTNTVQYQLSKLLAAPQNNLFVVGDFAQSIYAWRGADYRNMLQLKHDYPDIAEYRLEQNYRSTQTILDAATNVISQTDEHPILELWTEKPLAETITVLETKSDNDEAQQIMSLLTGELRHYSYNDVAILYRTNAQSRAFEEACLKLGIPYRLIGGFKFYERKEVKDVLSYLKFLLNRDDSVSKERALKLGKRRFNKFLSWADQTTDLTSPHELLKHILDVSEYRDRYDEKDPDDVTRLENIQELLNVAAQFQEVATFLENVALVQDNYMADAQPTEIEENALTLMSLHSAKGLEYPVIFMVGMEDGLLPHSRSIMDKKQLEEERRLCYVGITRAMERLYFTHSQQRWQYGSRSYSLRSRFLQDIPEHLLKSVSTAGSTGYNQGQSKYNRYSNNTTAKSKSSKRRLVLDDDSLEAVLHGDMDLDSFLDS